jgi:GH35 family endo-1,4-beta-xylanase
MTASRREFLGAAARIGAAAGVASVLPLTVASRASAAKPRRVADAVGAKEVVTGAGSLGAVAAGKRLLYGSAVDMRALAVDPVYATLIREQCRIVVAENVMKWGWLRPTIDSFRFEDADALVGCGERGNRCGGWETRWPAELGLAATGRRGLSELAFRTARDADPQAVLTWGISDRYTWLNYEDGRTDPVPERPLLFDAEGRAAAAFYAVREAFERRGTV